MPNNKGDVTGIEHTGGGHWVLTYESGAVVQTDAQGVWDAYIVPLFADASPEGQEIVKEQILTLAKVDHTFLWIAESAGREFFQSVSDAEQRLQNSSPPEVPSPVPANRIDGSQSQGTGPLPEGPYANPEKILGLDSQV